MDFLKKRRFAILFKKALLLILLFAFFSIILTWFLEFRYFDDINKTWELFFKNSCRIFLFNSFIMFLLIAFVYAITLKPWFAIGFISVLTTIVAYVNENKFASRMAPLLPEDLKMVTELNGMTNFIDIGGLTVLTIGIAIIIVVAIFLSIATKRLFSLPSYLTINEDGSKKHFILKRIILSLFTAIVFFASTSFIINNNGAPYQYIWFIHATFVAWNQEINYSENGFLIGFLYNCGKFDIKSPSDYSEDYVKKIAKEYSNIKYKEDSKRQSLDKADYNIVVVLGESFYDPEILSKYYQYSGGDITPNLHKIIKKYPSGQMYSLDYGGGTANMEFEVLTSLTNYYLDTVPYINLIPKAGETPSIATWGKKNGYNTTAIHTYYDGMYKRNISVPNEGFEQFITKIDIKNPETEPGSSYYNDKTAYNEVLKVLKDSEQKQVVSLVTMQNHVPYEEKAYNGARDFKLTGDSKNYDEDDKKRIETYFQLLHNSDKYLGDFISELDKLGLDEKTVVLFFGDHSPGVFQAAAEDDINISRLTPYFIYSNFAIDLGEKSLPTTTPNCLVNTLYNRLNVKKPTIHYLLDEVCKENPILTMTYYGDDGLTQTETLDKYENVTYDILSGKKYWMNATSSW